MTPETTMPSVVCVVLNYNGWQDTIACVRSLLAQDYPALHILIVDNASPNDSVTHLRAALPGVELLIAAANDGFAAGCNLGTRLALARNADFVWLLNNDTIAPPDTLTKLVATAQQNPRVGITGTVLRYMHAPAEIQAWGGGSILRSFGYSTHFHAPTPLRSNSFLTFASVLLRREMLTEIGLLDDGYFMYFEDADLCFRAQAAGWQLAVAADTAVLHKEGGSSSPSRTNPNLDRRVTASGIRFLARYGRPRLLAPTLFVLSRLARRLVRGDLLGLRAVLHGMRDAHRKPTTGGRL